MYTASGAHSNHHVGNNNNYGNIHNYDNNNFDNHEKRLTVRRKSENNSFLIPHGLSYHSITSAGGVGKYARSYCIEV